MILAKSPKLMTDEELATWAVALISRKAPESDMLDYKEQLSTDSQKRRVELGKDVSSFANERGGVLLYGVPETRDDDAPIPVDLDKCGLPSHCAQPLDLENILLDTVRPPLPELDIRLLSLPGNKPIVFIHHPRSWSCPHMVQGYGHGRYYRRGNYRTVLMSEQEVEAAYSARRATILTAQTFFQRGTLSSFPFKGSFLRITACPMQTIVCRKAMGEEEFKIWLSENLPGGRRGTWAPFIDGWRFSSGAKGAQDGKQFEFRLFHNGAVSFSLDIELLIKEQQLDLTSMQAVLHDYFFSQSSKAFAVLGIHGPLVLEIKLRAFKTLSAFFKGESWIASTEPGMSRLGQEEITFEEETSAGEVQTNGATVIDRVMDRLASAFGLWRK